MLRPLVIASLTFMLSAPAVADVYRFKDEHGNTLYTDKPSTLPAERLNVKSQKTDVVALEQRQQEEQKRRQDAAGARQQTTKQRAEDKQAAELTAKDKAERCTKARERYDSYMNSQRLFEQLPNGERRYLSDAELDTARAAAKTTMDEMCK